MAYYELITSLAAVFLLVFLISHRPEFPEYSTFKRFGAGFFGTKPVHVVVQNAYDKLGGVEPFVVRWWARDIVIMPRRYLKDLKSADRSHISFFTSISRAFYLHTTVGDLYTADSSHRMVDVVKKGLNRRLPHLTPVLVEEIDYSFHKILGESTGNFTGHQFLSDDQELNPAAEWVEVKAAGLFAEVVHRAATRILVSKELSRNERFIKRSLSYTKSLFVTALIITNLPLGPLRGILAWPLSCVRQWLLRECKAISRQSVINRVEESHKPGRREDYEDAIQWTLDLFPQTGIEVSIERFQAELLQNLWAASGAPGGVLTEVIFQLLLHPEELEIVRDECIQNYRENVSVVRTVRDKPFQFSDGLILPVGSWFGFPIQAFHQEEQNGATDRSTFIGFRFVTEDVDHSIIKEKTDKMGPTMVDTNNLVFGYGNHACPGRFIAVKLIKLVITTLLIGYEIKWENKTHKRPTPINVEGQFAPNMEQSIFIRKRNETA
ncbi:hypothetical protein PFICI_09681 [Pestalotiopsis fici W106-1]|uniref:Cytochrome P450 n=1 Tax=Pestalotiopsis fici (strain W106-1 / CGMCC3.15140) TaxID=1229662 RepID=W3WUX8_PESFW|nr:uncharacterized protein PFICI_09681 [Pestalotiopsis fici W106-1]ETS77619.1 hypothetical protein PFICI_09681 [Pestalotiopsis fici W106-1]